MSSEDFDEVIDLIHSLDTPSPPHGPPPLPSPNRLPFCLLNRGVSYLINCLLVNGGLSFKHFVVHCKLDGGVRNGEVIYGQLNSWRGRGGENGRAPLHRTWINIFLSVVKSHSRSELTFLHKFDVLMS